MRDGIHPAYGPVVFRDRSTSDLVLTRSTLVAKDPGRTVELDGVSYPVFDVDVTRYSHPFWTGTARSLDSEGRVERFRRHYGAGS